MMAAKLSFRWPQCARTDLKKIIHSSNSDGINLITATLSWNPTHRPNAVQVHFLSFDLIHFRTFYSMNLVFKTFVFQSRPRFGNSFY